MRCVAFVKVVVRVVILSMHRSPRVVVATIFSTDVKQNELDIMYKIVFVLVRSWWSR